jgi:hypothetical protein
MSLTSWFFKTAKEWTVGPITLGGERIGGISGGAMACTFHDAAGALTATVDGTYAEVDGADYFVFALGSDDQDAFTEDGQYTYEHVLTVSGQDYMAAAWRGKVRVLARWSD